MSYDFSVKSSKREYGVQFKNDFADCLRETLKDGDAVVVDGTLLDLYKDTLGPILTEKNSRVITPSETQKEYGALVPVLRDLIERGFRKDNRLIAIGGGITQDVTSFIASILFRGVDWIFFPTTLLAQCDSCIGSKSSINFGEYKNQLGGFHPPAKVVINLGFLETLSEADIRSGMGEMIHYFLVSGEEDFQRMRDEGRMSFEDDAVRRGLILRSLEIKKAMIEIDEFDEGPRNVFNYGHSFGHAIESLTEYNVPHGIAVSFGMDIANFLSARLGYISDELRMRIRELLEMNWGETRLPAIDMEEMKARLMKDKKTVGGTPNVILTKGLGQMFKTPLEFDEKVTGWMGECLAEYW